MLGAAAPVTASAAPGTGAHAAAPPPRDPMRTSAPPAREPVARAARPRSRPFNRPPRRPAVHYDAAPLGLPAVLVEDILRKNEAASASLVDSIRRVQESAGPIRAWLKGEDMLRAGPGDDGDAATTCGIDGSYVLDHMLTTSVVACAAVAVEGFVPPRHDGFWPVKHRSHVGVEAHSAETTVMVRGLMRMMEAELAAAAPHDVVLFDGSAASQIIHVNQAMSAACGAGGSGTVGRLLREGYPPFLGRLAAVLESRERIWASLPKFTERSELGDLCRRSPGVAAWPDRHDDKSVMTAALGGGEYTQPVPLTRDGDDWHLRDPCPDAPQGGGLDAAARAVEAMGGMHVLYYKPAGSAPALRVEVAAGVAADEARLHRLLSSLRHQHASYAIMEPYPLYMADRMVKSLGGTVPILRQSAMRHAAGKPGISLDNALLSMRGYRTEIGL